MFVVTGMLFGFGAWFVMRYVLTAFYTVDQNERAVKTIFGRAERVGNATTANSPLGETLTEEHKQRYNYPQVRVIQPGGPYFKWPWERIYKVSIATQTINMAQDPEDPTRQRRRHHPGSGDQRPAQHRADRPDPLPGGRKQPVRLPVWGQAAHLARDGLFCLGAARTHRQL